MSIRLNSQGDYLETVLTPGLTISTGSVVYGHWAKRIVDTNTYCNIVTLSPAAGAFPALATLYDTNGDDFIAVYSDGTGTSFLLTATYPIVTGDWVWMVQSRSGSSVSHVRLFDDTTSTAPFFSSSYSDPHDYASLLDTIGLGWTTAYGGNNINGEIALLKIQTGVSWTDAEARLESQKFLIQKAGGVERYSFGLETTSSVEYSLKATEGGNYTFSNTGAVNGASRPTQLENVPSPFHYDPAQVKPSTTHPRFVVKPAISNMAGIIKF
jgi:hypothetical protein